MSSGRRLLDALPVLVPSFIVGAAAGWIGGPIGLAIIVAWIAALVWIGRERIRRRLPARCRASMAAVLDPDAGPPPDAVPIPLEAPRRWAQAITARDWSAARAVLAEDFALADPLRPGRRYGRRRYMRATRAVALAFPDLRVEVDEVCAQPEAPDVAWVRFSELGHPRRGPVLDATWWERWTLDAGGRRVRETALEGVTRLA